MMLPMKVHAVKIRYREQMLRRMVHGRFGDYKGKRCVYVTYTPKDKKLSRRTQKRYFVDSRQGKEYTKLVQRFITVKSEYDKLLLDWRSTYVFEPPMVRFPITYNYDPHQMNNSFFKEAEDNSNGMKNDNPVYAGDDVLKSKNEQFGRNLFKSMGIPYKYEAALDVPNSEGYVPDFLLSFYEIDRCIYAELFGMTDKFEYSNKTTSKLTFYSRNHYRPGREITYAFMYDKSNFDEGYFAALIMCSFDCLIPDSALDWENCTPPDICGD